MNDESGNCNPLDNMSMIIPEVNEILNSEVDHNNNQVIKSQSTLGFNGETNHMLSIGENKKISQNSEKQMESKRIDFENEYKD